MSITDQFDQLSGVTAHSISDLKALRNASLDNAYSKLQQELSSHYTSLENVASDVSHTSSAALTLVNSVKSTYEGVRKALNRIKQRKLEKQDDEADEEEAVEPDNENLEEDDGYEADLEDFDDYDFVDDFSRNNAFLGAADEEEADADFEALPETENFWNANVDNLADFDDQPVLMTRANPVDPDQYRVVLRKSDDPLESMRQIEEEDRLFAENQRQNAPEEESEFEISPEELEGPISLDDKPSSTIDTAEAEPESSEFVTASEGEQDEEDQLEPESAEAETQPIESDVAAVSTEAETEATEATPDLLEGAEVELTQLGGDAAEEIGGEALGELGGEIAGEAGAEIGTEVAVEAATALISAPLDFIPVAGQILGAVSLIGAVAGGIGTAYSIGQEYSSKLSAAQEQLKEEKSKPVDVGGQFSVGSLSSVNRFRQ